MKKFILAAFAVILLSSAAIASNTIAATAISRQFKADYPGAAITGVHTGKEHTTIHFTLNNQQMQAFYDNEGNKLATSRNIGPGSLPAAARQTLAVQYRAYIATEAIEMDHVQDGLCYYVRMQQGNRQVILCISSEGIVSVFKKM
jgi:opacity protein-like surface antigen